MQAQVNPSSLIMLIQLTSILVCIQSSLLIILSSLSSAQGSLHMTAAELDMPDHFRVSVQQEWNNYFSHLCAVSISQQTICDLLGPDLIYHAYELSPTQLRRSLAFVGPNHRLRRVTRDLISGSQMIHVGVIGTSISWGTGASERGTTDWFSLIGSTLKQMFPKADLEMHNGCFPGTPSSFANMCHSKMVKPDVDLLFVEYITNEFPLQSMFHNVKMEAYERLLRKILQRRRLPAVLLVQLPARGQSFPSNYTEEKRLFHESSEDQYGSMAQYYSVPWLSYRNAVWHDVEHPTPSHPHGNWESISPDHVHPNDLGHRMVKDLVVWLITQTAIDLVLNPFSKMDGWYLHRPLPPPMHRDNYEERLEMCLMDDELKDVVKEAESSGWSFVNEGTALKPKTGYVSRAPGSKLVMELRMGAVLGGDAQQQQQQQDESALSQSSNDIESRRVSFMLSHLRSYDGMGMVRVSCERGCNCSDTDIDAYHEQRSSTTFMQLILVTALSDTCILSVTVLEATQCPKSGHKFKVSAIMMNRAVAQGFAWPLDKPAQFVAKEIFTGEFGNQPVEDEAEPSQS
ncbi:hypothetical protein CEUSTIGMA_g10659.t1 [Chlamydomonas eustigma]|uniref:SGNH hydrolase-type esterase domain-containing protein n=1 Tax=Chlamydomonas eustigma TaxID=1157962 RepID=A0A250XJM5_9CHLO|nr:hypothetical protein CEUSTIGMA_g10659.t1 [Chlamydomonas eustigma]|eukprot:GAX83233.1 hypothetical protein CEUSTIGMA_g10659.t1 [Chlamydomonas eustigma]